MKILVIDDSPWNIASVVETLAGHNVVTVDNIKEAYQVLKDNSEFDAVLTDLWLPRGKFCGEIATSYAPRLTADEQIPAGLVFAIKASNLGIRTVICTDSDHHRDWICSLLDLVGHVPPSEGAKGDSHQRIAYVEARCASMKARWEDGNIIPCEYGDMGESPTIKDWGRAMRFSGLFPEIVQD
ncbi:hypothetical protein MNBD_BACTEROID05-50 [hydrothermal vent metagenome]|uniref:Response regulatory domain-containing protein n=1 Tax=hydrothermal vent metagenome TaxID=652676 RepID=A0A3B0U9W1_9ZZZZ